MIENTEKDEWRIRDKQEEVVGDRIEFQKSVKKKKKV